MPDLLRVLMNDRCLRGPRTGVGHYVAELLAALPAEAPDVEVVPFYRTFLSGDRPPSAGGKNACRTAGRPPWLVRRAALAVYNAGLRLAGRVKRCRLYHEPNHIPASWGGPIVATMHDLSVVRHPEWHPRDRVRWYEKDLPGALARTSHFITVSAFSRQEMTALLNIPAERITVIGLGVRGVFRPRPAAEVRGGLSGRGMPSEYFFSAGTLEPRKNVAGLLAAYARLPAQTRRAVPLVIAGAAGWGRQTLAEWIDRHALGDCVRVLGYVDDESLAWLYAGARALVWPTLYEGFGLPPLECMACGTPVITSRLASLPEVTGQAALLVDPRDENELAEAMVRILEDRDLGDRLRAAGLARSRDFSWSRCAREHAAIYRRFGDA